MNKKLMTRILYVTIILAIIGAFIMQLFDINIFAMEGLLRIPSLISGIVLFWIFYFSMGWKLPILNKLAYRKNLNGTWFGKYYSKNFTSEDEFKGKIAIVVRQSFLNLNVKSFTDKHVNFSFGEVLNYHEESESHELIYLYAQSEFNPTVDTIRKGTAELKLLCSHKKEMLFGDFWTNHNSKGNLKLKKISTKHSKSFTEASKLLNKKK